MAERDHRRGRHLHRALEVLEKALEAPVVPGETETRAEGVCAAVEEAREAFVEHVGSEHQRALREIADADPALLHRVERMKHEDGALREGWDRARIGARELRDAARADPRDESDFRRRFEAYVVETLDLLLRTRTQEAAIATWTREAFQRDRGGGD